jgi:transcriptional regulator GlxA family with amidase domain
MKHISILVPSNAILGSIEGPRQVFTETNKYLQSKGNEPFGKIELVGVKNEIAAGGNRYKIFTDSTIDQVQRTDLIIIPAIDGHIPSIIKENEAFLPWIVKHYKSGTEVASLCVGAFLLASTGLLNGRKCATHWMAANGFRKMFPEVDLVEDRIITDEQGIYTSGGAFSYLNLILYLIEKFQGRNTAIYMSKAFQIDIERKSQAPFILFKGQKDHEDDQIKKAQEYIEVNYQNKITVDEIASLLFLGRRNFERRFKKATCNTVMEYIQRVKIEAAKKCFETNRKNINEVMYDVGYSDTKAFRMIFKKITGMTPIEYRNKYGSSSLPIRN